MQHDRHHVLGIFWESATLPSFARCVPRGKKDGYTRCHGKIARPLSPDMNPIEHTWNMLARSSSGTRMHPRCDESSLLRHWRMARHTARCSAPSFWKVCILVLLRPQKNVKIRAAGCWRHSSLQGCISFPSYALHSSIFTFKRLFITPVSSEECRERRSQWSLRNRIKNHPNIFTSLVLGSNQLKFVYTGWTTIVFVFNRLISSVYNNI